MPGAAKNVLLTGTPGCGKTTVVCRVVEALGGQRLAGFYTREIRQAGKRLGFEAVGLGGARAVLAHVDFRSANRVGRYGVDVPAFESLIAAEFDKPAEDVDLFVIDEIGKMECFSGLFIERATSILDGPTPVLATVAAKGGGFIAQVKSRPDVLLITVRPSNREQLPAELAERFG